MLAFYLQMIPLIALELFSSLASLKHSEWPLCSTLTLPELTHFALTYSLCLNLLTLS